MYPVVKRILGFILSLVAFIILSPILLIVAIAIKLDSKGPVFFKQERVGRHKKPFYIYKFRSMYVDAPADMPTHLLENPESMITKVGGFLRKTSLDELPQLINIIKGDMAIVGPRPSLFNQTDLIEERDKYAVHELLPGLTGWAQINGRDELPIKVKAELDGYYKNHMSLGMDIKCVIGTVISVAKSDGVVEGGTGTLEKNEKDLNNR